MSEKRYAIVRVDNKCPVVLGEDINLTDRIKMFPCFNDKRISCEKCRYGDTKLQLIRKVAQAINKARIHECKTFVEATNKIAKEIVEFLGVVE